MKRVSEVIARKFPVDAFGVRYRNQLEKLSDTSYRWRATTNFFPCSSQNFKIKNIPHRLEVTKDHNLRIRKSTSNSSSTSSTSSTSSSTSSSSLKLIISKHPSNNGDSVKEFLYDPLKDTEGIDLSFFTKGKNTSDASNAEQLTQDAEQGTTLDIRIEGQSSESQSPESQSSEGQSLEGETLDDVNTDSNDNLQSIFVHGETAASWKIKFDKKTKNLSELFPVPKPIIPAETKAGSDTSSISTITSDEKTKSIFSRVFGDKADPDASKDLAFKNGGGIDLNYISSPKKTENGVLISTPFRLYNVLLGDFWLELHPHIPFENYAAIFFRCGYPGLSVKVQIQVGNFSKTVVVNGRSEIEVDLKDEQFLSTNFELSNNWKSPGEIEVQIQLLEILRLPSKIKSELQAQQGF